MATTFLSPICNGANFSVSGVPASGYKLFTYTAGTTTKQTTYQDNAGATPNANPIILSSQGYPSSGGAVVEIWLTQGVSYKFVMAPSTDTDPPSSPIWTRDNISGVNDPGVNSSTAITSEWILGTTPTFVSATSFTVATDLTSIYNKPRRIKTSNSGGTIYSQVVLSSFGGGITTVTVKNDSGVLDSGLTSVSYALLSGINPSVPPFSTTPVAVDSTDASKRVKIAANRITTATDRTLTAPDNSGTIAININRVCDGRLTLTTAVPVTISDVTAATVLYFSPYSGNAIALYDGNIWNIFAFTETNINVPATTSQMYDVFAFNNAGTVNIEVLAWTNDTTRATALVLQDGVLCKTGVLTRRYVGSFRTTTVSGQTEDSVAKRYVWNYYNRIVRKMLVQEATATWTYTTNTYRQANAAVTNQLDMVIGVQENPVKASVLASASNTGGAGVEAQVGIGVDSTTVNSADLFPFGYVFNTPGFLTASWQGFAGVGRHTLVWLEKSVATNTTTWEGSDTSTHSGISGELLG